MAAIESDMCVKTTIFLFLNKKGKTEAINFTEFVKGLNFAQGTTITFWKSCGRFINGLLVRTVVEEKNGINDRTIPT
jgi:hypothetical protein